MKITSLIVILTAPLLLTGCASILDGGPKIVQISSNPPGAKVSIYDKTGKEIDSQNTPASVALKRVHGYLNPEDYKLVFENPGYYPYELHVKSTLDGWYLGNVLFGGLIGIVIVDPATGDMFTLSPREVNCNLVSSAVPLTPEELKAAELKANPVSKAKAPGNPKSKN
jgi:hypothetical protein